MNFWKCRVKYKGWSSNEHIAKILWNVFDGEMNVVICDSVIVKADQYSERLEYYRDTYDFPIGGLGFNDAPNFDVLSSYEPVMDSEAIGSFTIVRPIDIRSLEGMLTFTSGDEIIHVFPSSFSVHSIHDLFIGYIEAYKENEHLDFFQYTIDWSKEAGIDDKVFFIDTYCDDEDSENYFLVCGQDEVLQKKLRINGIGVLS